MHLEYISASRLKTYMQCPFKYFLQYEMKLPELREPTHHTEQGIVIHEVLEEYVDEEKFNWVDNLNEKYENKKPWQYHPDVDDSAMCDDICDFQGDEGSSIDKCCEIAQSLYSDAYGMIKKLHARERDNPLEELDKILGTEVMFDEKFTENVRIHGYIDLVSRIDSDTIEVRDYKSGNYKLSYSKARQDIQLRVYSLAAKRLFPSYDNAILTLDYLRKSPVTVLFTEEDDRKTLEFLETAAEKIKNCDYPKRQYSWLCNFCIGWDRCNDVYKELVDSGASKDIIELNKLERERRKRLEDKEDSSSKGSDG